MPPIIGIEVLPPAVFDSPEVSVIEVLDPSAWALLIESELPVVSVIELLAESVTVSPVESEVPSLVESVVVSLEESVVPSVWAMDGFVHSGHQRLRRC